MYTPVTPILLYKSGVQGGIHHTDTLFWCNGNSDKTNTAFVLKCRTITITISTESVGELRVLQQILCNVICSFSSEKMSFAYVELNVMISGKKIVAKSFIRFTEFCKRCAFGFVLLITKRCKSFSYTCESQSLDTVMKNVLYCFLFFRISSLSILQSLHSLEILFIIKMFITCHLFQSFYMH